jgi:hypothetical protein
MVFLPHCNLHSHLILCLQHEDFSCDPWFSFEMNFMLDNLTALCDKYSVTRVLVKIPRNICYLHIPSSLCL